MGPRRINQQIATKLWHRRQNDIRRKAKRARERHGEDGPEEGEQEKATVERPFDFYVGVWESIGGGREAVESTHQFIAEADCRGEMAEEDGQSEDAADQRGLGGR